MKCPIINLKEIMNKTAYLIKSLAKLSHILDASGHTKSSLYAIKALETLVAKAQEEIDEFNDEEEVIKDRGNHWLWPPTNEEDLDDWLSEHNQDAIAYGAGWTDSGKGHGPTAGRTSWPGNPGFDWDSGLPDWDTGLEEEPGYEYRTSLMDSGSYGNIPKETEDGFELVQAFNVNPEPEVTDEDGDVIGNLYLGEGPVEAVYRKRDEDDFEEDSDDFNNDDDDGDDDRKDIDKKRISKLMLDELRYNFDEYDDYGDVNCTKLAEDICDQEDLHDAEGNVPEELFDLAFEVSEQYKNEEDDDDSSGNYDNIKALLENI
jgi:hypothetical protein